MARAEAKTTISGPEDRQRARVRVISMAAAIVLMVAAAVVLTRHHPPARSTAAFCTQVAHSADLASVLASGDTTQIRAAVHHFDQAAQVAPPTIESQVAVLVAYADGLAAAMAHTTDAAAGLRAAMADQQAKVAAVNTAGRQVDQFVVTNCHLTLNPASSSTAPSAPATTAG